MARHPEAAMLAKRTLTEISPELKGLAEELGVSYASLKAWKAGRRSPAPENLDKLADLSEEQAEKLLALSARLRREANTIRQG